MSSPSFIRPSDWPSETCRERGLRCPQCKSFTDLAVVGAIWVYLDADRDRIDRVDEFCTWEEDSAAHCRHCDWAGRVSDCNEIPEVTHPLSSIDIEWETDTDVGSALWMNPLRSNAAAAKAAYDAIVSYWPGVTISVDGGDVCVALCRNDVCDALNTELEAILGRPDSIRC